ncbi:MAG TPA: ABC transporter substrate-binding protein [Candidatus Limnocylindrales bacterium]|nr:ABC transporter substrate-binding protein [Candidatus Limnocylindrales bacterium]
MANRTGRWVRLWVLLAVAAIAVAACSSGGESAAPGGESAAPPASAPAGESAAPGGSPAAGGEFNCENIGGEVSVVGSWTGAEQDSFLAMVAPWEECSGATVNYTGSRDLAAQLTTGIASGTLPDVAGLPGPGLMKEWYDQGALKPLSFVDFATYEANTPPGFAAAGKASDGQLLGIFTKAAVKGLIYYNKANWQGGDPATWDELNTTARGAVSGDEKQWCIGVESGAASGWPGTDWVEDIVLRQAGPDVYDAWVAGEQKWTSPEIKAAFETFGDAVANAYGGSNYIVTTNFGKAANPMFADPPGCLLHHQASFITDFFKNEAGAQDGDFDFFVMPDINPEFSGAITTAGDLFGMFNDTPQAQSLINYLLTAEAQQIWVERGGFISMNKNVPADVYPDDTSRRSAEILAGASSAKFDASDLMPNAMNQAFFEAIVAFVQNPGDIDSILSNLDNVQADAYGG